MRLLKLILSFGLLAIVSTANASAVQCRNLFVSNANQILEVDIEKRIEALAISYLKLSETQPESKNQVIAHVNKELTSLMQVNGNSIHLFKQKISELKNSIENSRKHKEKEDEIKRNDRENIIERQNPINLAKKMIFHEIQPGKFMMGETGKKFETEITNPFAMMQTQFTQMMWARLKIAFGEKNDEKINPSDFKTGDDSITANIEGIRVEMKPDHPVEKISYDEVTELLVGLNKLSNSSEAKDQALLQNLIPGHQKGDVYDLPTDAQWEFVMRNRGSANKEYFDRDNTADLARHAWFDKNSGKETHAVATRQPRIIDGKEFFDLEGNVTEWMKNWVEDINKGAANPQGPGAQIFRSIRGGNWRSAAPNLRSSKHNFTRPEFRYNMLGFRLVRTRP